MTTTASDLIAAVQTAVDPTRLAVYEAGRLVHDLSAQWEEAR